MRSYSDWAVTNGKVLLFNFVYRERIQISFENTKVGERLASRVSSKDALSGSLCRLSGGLLRDEQACFDGWIHRIRA